MRITVDLNGKLNSNIEGTLSAHMNPTAGSLTISTTLENFSGLSNATGINASGATIMLYEVAESTSNETTHPVGIRMTAYGTNNSSYIDMYGGTASTDYTHPIVRIGRLNGITFNGKTFGTNELPAAWGIYTLNGYFEGAVVAKEGKIANFTIASDKLYTGTHSAYNTNVNGIFIDDTYISFGKQALTYFKNDGTGKIGNWKIDSISLYNGTFGTANSAMISTGSSTAKVIGGSKSISGWTFTSGANFGVTKTGALYANDVNISGAVNATSLHVGSSTSANHLIYENSTIDLQTDWLKFDDGVVTIGQDNNSQIFLDGQSIDLKDENGLTYFYVGDKRINGVYTFTMEHPYMVTNNYSSNSIGVDYVINSNYPVTVYDEENNEIPIDRIHSTQIVSDSYKFLKGKVYKILFTTSSPVYNFSYVQKPDFIGSNAVVFARRGKSYGTNSFTEGIDTTASGRASHAEGEDTTASGSRSHAEGEDTTASGNYGSHAEGNNTIASGDWGSHAEGNNTTASSLSSHAEGDGTTASGWYSHAEGDGTTASGRYGSHAEGDGTVASSDSSHAEGYHTTASGWYSHAEGFYTTASGNYGSHAEGYSTVASGKGSHASGQATYATRDYQTVIGRYNSVTTSTDSEGNTVYDAGNYVFVIGNGDTSTRSNALTVDWNGKVNNVDLYCISTEGIKVTHDYQTAIGKYNEIRTSVNETGDGFIFDSGNYALVIGNGTSEDNRSNALTVDWNGIIRSCNPSVSTTSAPSSDRWIAHYNLIDSTGYGYGVVQGDFLANGETGITLQTQRKINNTYYQNHLSLHIKSDGTSVVTVGHPDKWRIALGVNIKTLSQNITTDQYGQCSVPSSLNGKTLLGIRTNNYQYGAFLIGNTNIRVFKISATPVAWAASVSVPLIFTYID